MKNRFFKKILLFAGMIGLPAFFILFLKQGKPHFHKLPYLGEHTVVMKSIDGKDVLDTVYYRVNTFSFKDENNQVVSEKDFIDNIVLVNFMMADCPSDSMNLCPMNFFEFKRSIYDELRDNIGFKDVRILSHFISNGDTVEDIKLTYAHHNIDKDKWRFVKGQQNEIFDAKLGLGNSWERKDSIYHNEREAYIFTLLLDKNRHVRGKYLTTMSAEIARITKEISLLLREEKLENE